MAGATSVITGVRSIKPGPKPSTTKTPPFFVLEVDTEDGPMEIRISQAAAAAVCNALSPYAKVE